MSSELEPQPQPQDDIEPVTDPGLPEHEWRVTDVDPAQERRTERHITIMFTLAIVLALGFCVAYFTLDFDDRLFGWSAQHVVLGLTLGGAMLLIGLGIVQWAKKLMADHEMVEMRHPAQSPAEDRASVMNDLDAGSRESGIGRRPLIRNTLIGAVAALGLPTVVLLRDIGPLPYGQDYTIWEPGMRIVNDVSGTPLTLDDIEVGQLVNAQPAAFFETDAQGNLVLGSHTIIEEKAKAAVILARMRPDDITPEPGRENWGIDGVLCYSKICTHVGCPISLWEQQTHHLLCPCHQTTYDLADNGKVVFGPAHRPLPQLPMGVDDEGFLIAMSDFPEIVGASYPEIAQDQQRIDESA